MYNRIFFFIPLLIISTFKAFTQSVAVSKITEKRTSSYDTFNENKIELEITVSGDETRKYNYVKVSKLFTALDDQDVNLLTEKKSISETYREVKNNAATKIELKSASRKARYIRELSGEISLYKPSVENGAIFRITNYQNKTNINLLPASAPIKMIYLTKESAEKFENERKKITEEELKKLPEDVREGFEILLKGFANFFFGRREENQVHMYIEGDQSKLVDWYFEDSDGRRVHRVSSTTTNHLNIFSFSIEPKPDWKLILMIESPNSVMKFPFKLTNVELP